MVNLSCLITTNMIQGGSKHENEIVNVGPETADGPLGVTVLFFPNTAPILSGNFPLLNNSISPLLQVVM